MMIDMLDATSSGECFSGLDSVLVLLEFYLMDMEDGVDVRCGRLGLRQISVATSHCKLEPRVTNAMKVRCSQDIYEYALKRMLPNIHWKKCEELLEYVEKMRSVNEFSLKTHVVWLDFSQTWFIRLFLFRGYQENCHKEKLERQNIIEKGCSTLCENQVTSFCDKNLSMQMEIQGSSNVKYYNDLELTSDVNGIIHLIGGYFHRGYFHLPPISSVLLGTIGNEIHIFVSYVLFVDRDRTMFIYKVSTEERKGCPSFASYTFVALPFF
ncbi:hypothetical protein V6N12_037215 [Hibiscus sabdariffa]|uniref:Uncharacterized protein n=1 Tax=Hibiscus sabdariffa TaxID=183260 RepID=A0ABR2C558_9ROSI